MKTRRHILPALLLILAAGCIMAAFRSTASEVPGLTGQPRTLLRIWITGSPGGGQTWLTQQLAAYEKQHRGVMTHLRVVSPEELSSPDAVLPDLVLCLPGDVTDPSAHFIPVSPDTALREPLLQSGRWQGTQYGWPLCWGAWVLAIDSALDPHPASTPAPTTLLGRPAATDAPTQSPGYPLEAVSAADCALHSPGGAALLTLSELLPSQERPPLPTDFTQLSPAEVYGAFQSRRCASAMLTTGQAIAFSGIVSAGKGFPFRLMAPDTVVTDQVWMAFLTPDAPAAAADLLAFLTSPPVQQALTAQGLHTVRDDLTLYAAGFSAQVEASGRNGLTAVNAFLPTNEVAAIAWQAFQGTLDVNEALAALQ